MDQASTMHAHHSGFPTGDDLIRLHCNENPYGPPPGAVAAATKHLEAWCAAYPDSDCTDLRERIAGHHGLDADQVAVGNGADELVLLAALTFVRPDDRVLTTASTFPGYAMAATVARAQIRTISLDGYSIAAPVVVDSLAGARLAYICNPHNPAGTVLDPVDVERILGAAEGADVIAVFDEAYMEFADPGFEYAVGAVRAGRRLLVLRTFSKAWGLAALRVGYALGPAELAEQVRRTRLALPFSLNRAALTAAAAALDCPGYLEEVRARTAEARERLYGGLRACGVEFVTSATNFVLARTHGDSTDLAARLASRHRVLVRDLTRFGLPGHLRITVGTTEHVERFCSALAAELPAQGNGSRPLTGLAARAGAEELPTFAPIEPASLFNGYVGANVVFALNELGVWEHLLEGATPVAALATAVGADPFKLLVLLRTAALLGYVDLRAGATGDEGTDDAHRAVALTSAGRELARRRGFFTWAVGGYGSFLRELAALTTGRQSFGQDVTRDGAKIAAGSGSIGLTLMLGVEREVVSGIEFDAVADLGCGDASRLIRLCRRARSGRGTGVEADEAAYRSALRRIAAAGLADRVNVVHADVLAPARAPEFAGVDLVTSFLMLHDLFNATGDPAKVMRLVRTMFPDAKRFLIADTVSQDWARHEGPLPIFSPGFELVHAFMQTTILSRETYERAFADAGLRVELRTEFGAPSTWLWLLGAE